MKNNVTFFLCVFICSLFLVSEGFTQDVKNSNLIDTKNELSLIVKLKAEVNGDIVKLEWESIPGELTILCSKNPITTSNWTLAEQIAVVSGTENSWSAQVKQGQSYYYAIIAKSTKTDDPKIFIPLENSTLVPVFLDGVINPQITFFTSFDVVTRNDAVILTWKSEISGKNLVLYRSTSPFINLESLVQSIPVSSFQDSGVPYVDYPVPGIPYFYAILDEDAIRTGAVSFGYNMNTNRIPVEIPALFAKIQRNPLPTVRPMPLPWLNPYKQIQSTPALFSSTTNKMLDTLVQKSPDPKKTERKPFVFAIDEKTAGGGEELALKKIIETYFITSQWEQASNEFDNFLSIRRTAEIAARARFYLGQICYFRGEYTNALLEFLLSQDVYYNKSREWIQYTMEKITY